MSCEKRTVICRILDAAGRLLSEGRNQCSPPGGKCRRLEIVSTREGYSNEGCNSLHAEIDALRKLTRRGRASAHTAVILGHHFACPPCELALEAAGIINIVYGEAA